MALVTLQDENARRPRLIDSQTGIQVMKGGITRDASFLESVVSSYTNLVNQPITLIFGVFLIFIYLSEEDPKTGPLESLKIMFDEIEKNATIHWEGKAAYFGSQLTKFLINWKWQFITVGFAWLPYIAKPSRNSMFLSVLHTLLIFLFRKWSSLTFILISQAHFLFVSIRKPFYRFIIILLVIAVLFLDIEFSARTKRNSDIYNDPIKNFRKTVKPDSGATTPAGFQTLPPSVVQSVNPNFKNRN